MLEYNLGDKISDSTSSILRVEQILSISRTVLGDGGKLASRPGKVEKHDDQRYADGDG